MSYKKFSKKHYGQFDQTAKDIVVRYVNSQGMFAMADEKYDADVKALCPIYYEGEIKKGWVEDWPAAFKTVDIPYRKAKLLKKHPVDCLFFMIIAGDLKHAWKIPATALTPDRVTKKNTKYTSNEKFFNIPLECCELITLIEEVEEEDV